MMHHAVRRKSSNSKGPSSRKHRGELNSLSSLPPLSSLFKQDPSNPDLRLTIAQINTSPHHPFPYRIKTPTTPTTPRPSTLPTPISTAAALFVALVALVPEPLAVFVVAEPLGLAWAGALVLGAAVDGAGAVVALEVGTLVTGLPEAEPAPWARTLVAMALMAEATLVA
jgi:hypothetical protein